MGLHRFGTGRGGGGMIPLLGRLAVFISALGAALSPGSAAFAQEASVNIELNRLQEVEGACRISLVFTNGLPEAVDVLSIETVLFNKEGAVERFLVLRSNPLPSGKVRVQQFDAKGLACDGVGRILLNDVKDCKIEGVAPDGCLGVIKPSSRTGVAFFSSTTASSNEGKQQ